MPRATYDVGVTRHSSAWKRRVACTRDLSVRMRRVRTRGVVVQVQLWANLDDVEQFEALQGSRAM